MSKEKRIALLEIKVDAIQKVIEQLRAEYQAKTLLDDPRIGEAPIINIHEGNWK